MARECQAKLLANGDGDGYARWAAVVVAIEELQWAERRDGNATVRETDWLAAGRA